MLMVLYDSVPKTGSFSDTDTSSRLLLDDYSFVAFHLEPRPVRSKASTAGLMVWRGTAFARWQWVPAPGRVLVRTYTLYSDTAGAGFFNG